MFFSDAIFNSKTTEPLWFKNIRIFIAAGLTVSILFYTIMQFKYLLLYDRETTIKVSKAPIINITSETYLCTSNKQPEIDCIGNGCNNISSTFSESCEAYNLFTNITDGYYDNLRFNINLSPMSSSTNTTLKSDIGPFLQQDYFDPNNSTHYISDQQLYVIFPNAGIFLSYDSERTACNSSVNNLDSVVILEPKNSYIININPTVKRNYQSNYDYWGTNWGLLSYNSTCYLNPTIKSLTKLNNEGNIQFGVRVPDHLTYETEIDEYTLWSTIAKLGGFYVALNSMYVLLFGMPKLSPWGILQKYVLRCKFCRRSLKKKLAKRYISSSGIVLSQKVSNRRNNATLEDRVQMLETMLQDYYLDNYQWELLRRTDLKYNQRQREYDEIKHQKTEEERALVQENDTLLDS